MDTEDIPVDAVRAVFLEAGERLKAATTNNDVIGKKEAADLAAGISDRRERALVRMLYKLCGLCN